MGLAVVTQQVGLMFAFLLLGLWAAKVGWISGDATAGLTNVLIYFVVPCVVINAFHRQFSGSQMREFGWATLIDFVSFPLTIGLAYLVVRRARDDGQRRDLRFGAVYSNSMFLGVPLAQALLGADGVFFVIAYVIAFNLFAWTHGYGMFEPGTGSLRMSLARIFTNPAIPSLIVGLVLFVTQLELPGLLLQGIGLMAGLNAPLSMVIVGASLAGAKWAGLLTDKWLWLGVGLRNLVVPLLGVLVLWAVPLPTVVRLAVLIPLACPVAAFLVMFSVKTNKDATFASSLVTLSTLMSVLTVPAMVALAGVLW
ncbi:MAG: AEC family transporter [Propionibacteriaceae bacterium]|nr:AEC family transporter [Propionibacteriaceae bacterium]